MKLRREVEESAMAALGIGPDLLRGTSHREAERRVLFEPGETARPNIVQLEAQRKLSPALTIRFQSARSPADWASLARALASLVASGYTKSEAAEVMGIS